MKLTKVIEEIEKCNDKKFVASGRNGGTCTVRMAGSYDGYTDVIVLEIKDDNYWDETDVLVCNNVTMSYDWRELIEPVSFDVALADVRSNHEEYTNETHRLYYNTITRTATTVSLNDGQNNHCNLDSLWKKTLHIPF